MTEAEARARVAELEELIARRYKEKVFGHPFVHELSEGRLPRKKLIGFMMALLLDGVYRRYE